VTVPASYQSHEICFGRATGNAEHVLVLTIGVSGVNPANASAPPITDGISTPYE
jgi:hypothetical protein